MKIKRIGSLEKDIEFRITYIDFKVPGISDYLELKPSSIFVITHFNFDKSDKLMDLINRYSRAQLPEDIEINLSGLSESEFISFKNWLINHDKLVKEDEECEKRLEYLIL